MKALPLVCVLLTLTGLLVMPEAPWAQPPFQPAPPPIAPPANPSAQRTALNSVRAQVNWLRNATRTASTRSTGSYGQVWQQFQMLRQTYDGFKATLTPEQLRAAANEIAELDAGLDILQQAFDEYNQDIAAGRAEPQAFKTMCQVLNNGAGLWLQELNKVAKRLRI
jgi:hypothetical protein